MEGGVRGGHARVGAVVRRVVEAPVAGLAAGASETRFVDAEDAVVAAYTLAVEDVRGERAVRDAVVGAREAGVGMTEKVVSTFLTHRQLVGTAVDRIIVPVATKTVVDRIAFRCADCMRTTRNKIASCTSRTVRIGGAGGTDRVVAVVGCLETTPRQLVLARGAVSALAALCVGDGRTLG